jgi:2-phospho-L-lactate/phosphoenolpyruvate guanylyltransferase
MRAVTTVAILPVKRFDAAKQRLAEGLTTGTRRALAEAMVTDVLTALRRTAGLDGVVVVTAEPLVEALARGHGARIVHDDRQDGQSAAASLGLRHADGADRALLVPGDCPALDPLELAPLLARPRADAARPEVVVVPDRHGTGTNALLLTPPDAIVPAFGRDSRARHEAAAEEAGVVCEVLDVPSLGLDVDTVEDLEALRAALGGSRGGAAHTRGLLARLDRARAE